MHAICTYEKSLFVTDVAACRNLRLVTSLSKTVAFLKKTLDVFMTLLQYMKKVSLRKTLTLRVAKENVEKVCSEVQRTVASVKERNKWSRGYSFQENPRFSHPATQRNEQAD